MVGLKANASYRLRAELRSKNIRVLVVKNSLAARAMSGTPLAGMFEGVAGSAAICWGGEDIVSLAKQITRLIGAGQYANFEARGGIMDGQQISAEQVAAVAKWPSRAEQLSLLVGQILSPGANLASQLMSIGGALASQIRSGAKGRRTMFRPPKPLPPRAPAAEAPARRSAGCRGSGCRSARWPAAGGFDVRRKHAGWDERSEPHQ